MAVSSGVDVCRTHAVINIRMEALNKNAHMADRTRIGNQAAPFFGARMTGYGRVPFGRLQVAGFFHLFGLFMSLPLSPYHEDALGLMFVGEWESIHLLNQSVSGEYCPIAFPDHIICARRETGYNRSARSAGRWQSTFRSGKVPRFQVCYSVSSPHRA